MLYFIKFRRPSRRPASGRILGLRDSGPPAGVWASGRILGLQASGKISGLRPPEADVPIYESYYIEPSGPKCRKAGF